MASECDRLFVYGSLRKGFHHPAYQYISDYFRFVSDARVRGSLHDMGEFPAAIPSDLEEYVIGELYELNHKDQFGWAFAQLDDYEGLNAEEDEPVYYRRDKVLVNYGNQSCESWIYWYNASVGEAPKIISGDVLEYRDSKNQ